MMPSGYQAIIRTSKNLVILRVLSQDIAADGDLTDAQRKELNTALLLRITELQSQKPVALAGRFDSPQKI